MFARCSHGETIALIVVAIALFPAGPFLALLALIAINQVRSRDGN